MKSKVVYLTAFEARPNVGTEAGLAWNWAKSYIKQGFNPVVLTSTIQNPDETYLWESANITIVTLGQSKRNTAPEGFVAMARSAFEFSIWRASCEKFLDDLPQGTDGIVHHLSWGSARLRPPLPSKTSSLVSVLGPLGGGHIAVFRGLNFRSALSELLRLATFLPSLINRPAVWFGRAQPSLVLSTNSQTRKFLIAKGFTDIFPMFADGISVNRVTDVFMGKQNDKSDLQLFWAGRFVPTKRPDLAVKIAAEILSRGHAISLHMAGSGPELQRVEDLAKRLNVRTVFLGKIPWNEMTDKYDSSFVFLFHSMRDSSSPGILEAASRAVPSVGLRVSGAGDFVPSNVFVGPDKFVTEDEFVLQTAALVEELITDSVRYRLMSDQAVLFSKTQTWDSKVTEVLDRLGR